MLSTRFGYSMKTLADKIERLKDPAIGSRDKDEMLLEFARVRCDCRRNVGALPTDDQIEMMEHE